MKEQKNGEYRSAVYTNRPDYADFEAPAKFTAITVNVLIGGLIAVLIYNLVIRPIERKHYRKMCIREGLAPKEEERESLERNRP